MKGAMRTWFVALAALAVVAAACGQAEGSGGGATGGGIEPSKTYTSIGEPEGELNLIAWAGYVEDGTSDGGEAYDWVTPFEDDTGCNVNVTYGDTSDEMSAPPSFWCARSSSRRREIPRGSKMYPERSSRPTTRTGG